MSKNKTQPTDIDPRDFIKTVENKTRQRDALTLLDMMEEITGERPVMWGSSIIGFGQYHYQYDSGREGDFMKTGFSPRKANMTIYAMTGAKKYPELLARLGPHKTSVACLYLTDFKKVDLDVLREIIKADYEEMCQKYD